MTAKQQAKHLGYVAEIDRKLGIGWIQGEISEQEGLNQIGQRAGMIPFFLSELNPGTEPKLLQRVAYDRQNRPLGDDKVNQYVAVSVQVVDASRPAPRSGVAEVIKDRYTL